MMFYLRAGLTEQRADTNAYKRTNSTQIHKTIKNIYTKTHIKIK